MVQGSVPSKSDPPFAQYYEELAPALYAWAALNYRGPLGHAWAAEDLVQEVCLEAISAFERYDPQKGHFRPWFFGVANLVLNNAMRRLASAHERACAILYGRFQMNPSFAVEERLVQAFLEQYIQDRDLGNIRSLEEYQDLFPSIKNRIAQEFQSLLITQSHESASAIQRLGHYRLLRLIGQGGQGMVYQAEDEKLNRIVALKILPRFLGLGPHRLPAQVQREMEVLSRLDHPGICVVYDAGESDGHAFLAMRFIKGRSLAVEIAVRKENRDSPSKEKQTKHRMEKERILTSVRLMQKVCLAIHAAHQAGVIHRDIKPANILVSAQKEPVVLDFGLARTQESRTPSFTQTGDVFGTPHYLSPERIEGRGHLNMRTDVWSLGVTLYEWLCGQRPFDGPTLETVARKITEEEPQFLCQKNPAIFEGFGDMRRCRLGKGSGPPLPKRFSPKRRFAPHCERRADPGPTDFPSQPI